MALENDNYADLLNRNYHRFSQAPYSSLLQILYDKSMPRPRVLERIKTAESEADEIIEGAKQAREDRIKQARSDAEEIRETAREEADTYEQDRLAEAREDIEAEREAILEEGKQDREELIQQAQTNIDDAVTETLSRFEEAINAQT